MWVPIRWKREKIFTVPYLFSIQTYMLPLQPPTYRLTTHLRIKHLNESGLSNTVSLCKATYFKCYSDFMPFRWKIWVDCVVCKQEFRDRFCFTAYISHIDRILCYWFNFKNTVSKVCWLQKPQQLLVDKITCRHIQAIPTVSFDYLRKYII